jgi:hypothetical protein
MILEAKAEAMHPAKVAARQARAVFMAILLKRRQSVKLVAQEARTCPSLRKKKLAAISQRRASFPLIRMLPTLIRATNPDPPVSDVGRT